MLWHKLAVRPSAGWPWVARGLFPNSHALNCLVYGQRHMSRIRQTPVFPAGSREKHKFPPLLVACIQLERIQSRRRFHCTSQQVYPRNCRHTPPSQGHSQWLHQGFRQYSWQASLRMLTKCLDNGARSRWLDLRTSRLAGSNHSVKRTWFHHRIRADALRSQSHRPDLDRTLL